MNICEYYSIFFRVAQLPRQVVPGIFSPAARQAAAPDALWDVAYYNGRYYVYFGIVPCLLFQLPFEALTGIRDLPPALPMILLAWLYILAVFGFVKQAARRWFPQASAAAYLLTAAGAASGTQIYYLLHRPSVYEYAILCGAAFVLWALWQWLCAANTPVNRRKALTFHLAFGSLCMALVAGCRPQMVLFAALALPILWPRYITEKRLCTRRGAGEAAAFILPVVLVAVGLMWYNAARFGSPFDFGANYNLTSNDMTRRGFAVGRIAPAAVTFLAGIPGVQTVFPYLTATRMQTNYMGLTITELYYGGAFACLPLLWGLAALPLARSRLGNSESLVYSLLKENQMPDPQTLLPGDQLYWVARAQDACAAREAQAGQNAEPSPESDPQKDCTEKQEALLKRIWIGSLIVGLLVGIVCSQLPGGLRWAVLAMLVLFFAYRAQRAVVAALYDQIESDQTYLMPEEETDEEQQ